MNFIIFPSHKPNKEGKTQLYLRARADRQKIEIPLKLYIYPECWVNDRVTAIKGKLDKSTANDFNMILDKELSKANDILINFRLKGILPTLTQFKEQFVNYTSRKDFITYMSRLVQEVSDLRKPGTVKVYTITLSMLSNCFGELAFADFDAASVLKFEQWLQRKGNSMNTIKKYQKTVKTFALMAMKEGLLTKNPYENYSIGRMTGNREFLRADQLQLLLDYFKGDIISPAQRNILRYFLFSCFTGIRYSDIKQLTFANLSGNLVIFKAEKTERFGRTITLPLNEPALALIQGNSGKLFNVMSEQVTNRTLKEIMMAVGINRRITFHCARHTFATLFLAMGGKVEVLQQLLGHAKIEDTMIYVKIMGEQKIEQIANFNVFQIATKKP